MFFDDGAKMKILTSEIKPPLIAKSDPLSFSIFWQVLFRMYFTSSFFNTLEFLDTLKNRFLKKLPHCHIIIHLTKFK